MSGRPSVWLEIWNLVDQRLRAIADEIRLQESVGVTFPDDVLPFIEMMAQIDEFIDVNELGLAYEYIVCALEYYPFIISGKSSVQLLEIGLLFRYKTERPEDKFFDSRQA